MQRRDFLRAFSSVTAAATAAASWPAFALAPEGKAFDDAVSLRYLRTNPAVGAKPPRVSTAANSLRYWTAAELRAFLGEQPGGDLTVSSPVDGTVLARLKTDSAAEIDAKIARSARAFERDLAWKVAPEFRGESDAD